MSSISDSESEVEVGVHRSISPYNAAQTAWGRDEKQTVSVSTIVQSETQVQLTYKCQQIINVIIILFVITLNIIQVLNSYFSMFTIL